MSGRRNQTSLRLLFLSLLLLVSPGLHRQLLAAPVNDGWSEATLITVPPDGGLLSLVASNAGATSEPSEPNHAGETVRRSVWWKFTAQETVSLALGTAGSDFDTVLAVYKGASLTNLSIVATNDDANGQLTSSVLFRAIAGETYFVAVDGVDAAVGSIHLGLGLAGSTEVPAWELTDVYGKPLRSVDFANKVVLIDFWETICQGCIDEIPQLAVLQERYGKDGFQILGLYKNSGPTNEVQAFAQNIGINYPIAELTPEVEAAFSALQPTPGPVIQTFPTKYLVDRENRLVFQVLDGAKTLALYEHTIVPLLRTGSSVKLQTRMDSGFLQLSWPGAEFGYVLEGSGTPSTNGWTTVLPINGERKLLVSPASGNRFFRLRKTAQ